jgi:hypothetical protein
MVALIAAVLEPAAQADILKAEREAAAIEAALKAAEVDRTREPDWAPIVHDMTVEQRIAFHRERVEAEQRKLCLDPDADLTRGAARPVIRDDFEQWESVSKAARSAGVKPDWICQAIRRKGTCGKHRWAYIDAIPDGFFEFGPGAASPWPYRYGNPVYYPEGGLNGG